MDKTESTKILAILRIAYPGFYRGTSEKDHSDTVVLWATMFPDDPFELVPVQASLADELSDVVAGQPASVCRGQFFGCQDHDGKKACFRP